VVGFGVSNVELLGFTTRELVSSSAHDNAQRVKLAALEISTISSSCSQQMGKLTDPFHLKYVTERNNRNYNCHRFLVNL